MSSDRPGALLLAPFSTEAMKRLQERVDIQYESWTDTRQLTDPEELAQRIQDENLSIVVVEADFLFEEVFETATNLRFVGVCRGEANNIDIGSATEHGVLVVNTPGRNAVSVAELTIGLMLALARKLPESHSIVKSGDWHDPVGPYISMRGMELSGKKAGIIGFGAIGREVARRLMAFDMEILAFDPYIREEEIRQYGGTPVTIEALLSKSDIVTVHCTSSPLTRGMLNTESIALMKPSAILVNTARWEIAEEQALISALEEHRIAGAAFDVYETHPVPAKSQLLSLDNVVLTPHIGGATDGTINRYSTMMVDDIFRFLDGEQPMHILNPEVLEHNEV